MGLRGAAPHYLPNISPFRDSAHSVRSFPQSATDDSRQYGKVPSGIGSMTWAKPAPASHQSPFVPSQKDRKKKSQAPPDPFVFSIRNTRSCPHPPPSLLARPFSLVSFRFSPTPCRVPSYFCWTLGGKAGGTPGLLLARGIKLKLVVCSGGAKGVPPFPALPRRVGRLSAWRLIRRPTRLAGDGEFRHRDGEERRVRRNKGRLFCWR